MTLLQHIHQKLLGFGIANSIEEDYISITRPDRNAKIRFEAEYFQAYEDYKKARSKHFDGARRVLTRNNCVEVQLTRLTTGTPYSEQYSLLDARGNAVIIGQSSDHFSFAFFDSAEYEDFFERRVKHRLLTARIFARPISVLIPRMVTACYQHKGRKTPPNLADLSWRAIKSSLFKVAVEQNDCFVVWKTKAEALRLSTIPVQTADSSIPRATYDENLVSYYKIAKATNYPSQSYLAYYHVLEYYFLRVSETILHDRLSSMLHAPSFSADSPSLDKIISIVRGLDARSDETDLLKNVLQKYVDKNELIEFIMSIETACGDKIYTKKRTIFGESIHVIALEDQVIGTTARTIKLIRNAIVHSSDRHKRDDRHIPLSESEDVIEIYIPLIKFMAERVIFGTATAY